MLIAVSGDGKRALSSADDRTAALWEIAGVAGLQTRMACDGAVIAVALSDNGKRALTGACGGPVALWDTELGERLWGLDGDVTHSNTVALSGDGKRALIGLSDDRVELWDMDKGTQLRVWESRVGVVMTVALSKDGTRAVSGSSDGILELWDTESGTRLRTMDAHTGVSKAVALSGDGTRALSGSSDRTVKLWDTESGACLRTMQGHKGMIRAVALSADGTRALSGSDDRMVKLWDTLAGEEIHTFINDTPILACALSSTQPFIICAGDRAGRVHLFGIEDPAERSYNQRESRPDIGNSGEDTMPMTDQTPRRVFISYTHDSDDHKAGVLALADRLRAEGIDARIDQYEPHPAEGWPRWMQRQIDEADYILAVCTATYRRRFEGNEQPGRGKGAIFESLLTLQDLYDNATINEHIIPVLMGSESDEAIPRALRAYTHYRLSDGYEALYRRLTGQPALTRPPIGKIQTLPPRKR